MRRRGPWGALAVAACLLLARETNTIRVPVRLVLVPTLVLDSNGRAVSGLEAKNFVLFDNGVRQSFQLVSDVSKASIAIAIQTNPAVSDYLPSVANTGALIDSLLLGEGGRAAVLAYADEVTVAQPFASGDASIEAVQEVHASGSGSRMIDAGMKAIALLKGEDPDRRRALLFIGQARDTGSAAGLSELKKSAAEANVTVYCLTLPIAGKRFVAATLSLHSVLGGGVGASVDLMKAIPALRQGQRQAAGADAFSVLAKATGGLQLHFRKQEQLENALIAIGTAIRSSYLLTFTPEEGKPGYHRIGITVDASGDTVYSRPGYWISGG